MTSLGLWHIWEGGITIPRWMLWIVCLKHVIYPSNQWWFAEGQSLDAKQHFISFLFQQDDGDRWSSKFQRLAFRYGAWQWSRCKLFEKGSLVKLRGPRMQTQHLAGSQILWCSRLWCGGRFLDFFAANVDHCVPWRLCWPGVRMVRIPDSIL